MLEKGFEVEETGGASRACGGPGEDGRSQHRGKKRSNVSATRHNGLMSSGNTLFRRGDLAAALNHALQNITQAVARWDEDSLLSTPESDICGSLEQKFLMEPLVLDRDGIIADSVKEGVATVRHFNEEVQVRQTVVAISVPFTGDPDLFDLRPSTFTLSPPSATIQGGELKLQWAGPVNQDAGQVRQNLDNQLDEIQKWVNWSTSQVNAHNDLAAQRIATEVQARKTRVLANRNLQASLGFPMRERPDAETYSVPINRRKIVPRRTTAASEPFRPEPVLDNGQYEAALEVLRNQRNALERSPGTSAKMGEEEIRNLLLMGLNSHFEGQAAGEVFNNTGKTDILIRVEDRHIFIGECKIWKGPRTRWTSY
ncbi:hypothetical protein [Streptomyces lunaelactis]|uniref:hypothetical protein n=1 Tax=Streptomyces lunaelactis TaxID=1535768 RepID=UPI001584511F|nr:hypothetical protein [Streptomyces lunaelactis]NUK03237.1 hypothetical protein [Streptomyces lunaelactis]NUK20660.1 hypothetical protein [Streptomyces lunaelactis]